MFSLDVFSTAVVTAAMMMVSGSASLVSEELSMMVMMIQTELVMTETPRALEVLTYSGLETTALLDQLLKVQVTILVAPEGRFGSA